MLAACDERRRERELVLLEKSWEAETFSPETKLYLMFGECECMYRVGRDQCCSYWPLNNRCCSYNHVTFVSSHRHCLAALRRSVYTFFRHTEMVSVIASDPTNPRLRSTNPTRAHFGTIECAHPTYCMRMVDWLYAVVLMYAFCLPPFLQLFHSL